MWSDLEVGGVSLEANWQATDWLTVKSITAYREIFDSGYGRDVDGTPYPIFHAFEEMTHDQFSQELQFSGATEKLKWLVGFYYFEEEAFVNVIAPLHAAVGTIDQNVSTDNDNWAVFSQATYNLTDKWALTAGIRYTEETKRVNPYVFAGAVGFAGLPPGATIVPNAWSSESFNATTLMGSISYQVTDDVMLYASITEGYKAGGFDQRYGSPQPAPNSYNPEEAVAYEVGVKSSWFDNRLRFNAAAFFTDYTELQIILRRTIDPQTFNAGEAEIKGFEIDAVWVPTPSWIVTASLGHIDAEYTRLDPDTAAVGNITTDSKLAKTPSWSGNIGVAYTGQIGGWTITPRMDWVFTDGHFADAINSPIIFRESTELLNAAITLTSPDARWEFRLAGRNLTDEEYVVSGTSALGSGTGYVEQVWSRPPEWTLSAKYNF